jgi:CheY-like chemotaxis protein
MRAPDWVLDAERDLHVVADAADAGTALREVVGHRPTVLVLDLDMPGVLTSREAIPLVGERSPGDGGRRRVRSRSVGSAGHPLSGGTHEDRGRLRRL